MAYIRLPGGIWAPTFPPGWGSITGSPTFNDNTVDADEEEIQFIGRVYLAGGSGSKTFGTSGSELGWVAGASVTFAVDSTLRVGVKQASSVDTANGPPGRATIGAAAFDVYKDLIGGTDTISSTTWRNDVMAAGTPFTVNHGDLIAICFHLNTTAGTPSVKIRATSAGQWLHPTTTSYQGGSYFTGGTPSAVLKFDDGTIGWLDGSYVQAVFGGSESIGNTNLYGNIFRLPCDAKIDAIGGIFASAGTVAWDFGIYSDPLGTPTAMSGGEISVDPQTIGNSTRGMMFPLSSELAIRKNTDYAIAVRQNSATSVTVVHYAVDDVAHFQANGLDSTCYAAKSTAGGAFAAQASSKRRAQFYFRISQIDTGNPGFIGA